MLAEDLEKLMFLHDQGVFPRSQKCPSCGHFMTFNTLSHGLLIPFELEVPTHCCLVLQYIHPGTTNISDCLKNIASLSEF